MRSLFDVLDPVAELLDSILLVEIGIRFVHVVVEICKDLWNLSVRFPASLDWACSRCEYGYICKTCSLDESDQLITEFAHTTADR